MITIELPWWLAVVLTVALALHTIDMMDEIWDRWHDGQLFETAHQELEP